MARTCAADALLAGHFKSPARNVDGIFRERKPRYSATVTRIGYRREPRCQSKYRDAFGSCAVSCEFAARLCSETVRDDHPQEIRYVVVIASICLTSIPSTITTSCRLAFHRDNAGVH